MSNYKILGPEWFPESEADYQELYNEHLVGTRYTNWGFLVRAARANLEYAAMGTSALLTTWARHKQRGEASAETYNLLLIRYGLELGGPCFGAVVSSAFAIESFTWLGMQLFIETEEDLERGDELLCKFDGLTAERRVHFLAKLTKTHLSKDQRRKLNWLITFRNDLAHDSSILFDVDGVRRRSHGRIKKYDPDVRYGGWLPSMHDNPMPLDLGHGLQAAELHDGIVAAVLKNADLSTSVEEIQPRVLQPILGVGRMKKQDMSRMEVGWREDFLPWRAEITNADREEWYRTFVRGMIKPVE